MISNFEYLRKVHHVRDNLQTVIAQVEFFSRWVVAVTVAVTVTETLNSSSQFKPFSNGSYFMS